MINKYFKDTAKKRINGIYELFILVLAFASVVIIVGVALFGVFTNYLASTFLTQRTRDQEKAIQELKDELGEINLILSNHHKNEDITNQEKIEGSPSIKVVVQSDSKVY